jgi:benzoate 4-monooxygenase
MAQILAMVGNLSWPTTVSVLSLLLAACYIVYHRFFHPLAGYPGPFWASITNLWKVYHLWTLHLPETLAALHDHYGEVVRVGPNDLSFRTDSATSLIYKGGRLLPKTKFYDGFTAFNPNLFGTQDEDVSIPLDPRM